MTHYEVLGVATDASPRAIREAFVALAREHHPDLHADAAATERARSEAEMQRINAAWRVLGDLHARREYDRTLSARELRSMSDREAAARRDGLRRTASGASVHFTPIDRDDDGVDPRLLDDTPYPGVRPPPRWMQVLPVALSVAGFGVTVLGFMVSLRPVVGAGFVLLAIGVVAFLLAPFYVMAQNTGR